MDDVGLLVSSELNVSGGQTESGEVLVDNKIRIFFRDDELDQGGDGDGAVGEGHH